MSDEASQFVKLDLHVLSNSFEAAQPLKVNLRVIMRSAPHGKPCSLKRLGFVQSSTQSAYCEAEKLYKAVRSAVPQFAASSLGLVEDRVMPIVAQAQQLGDRLLQFADCSVDYAVNKADKTINQSRNRISCSYSYLTDPEQRERTYRTALDSYFEFMPKAADFVVQKLSFAPGVQTARETLRKAAKTAREVTDDPDLAVQMAWEAWTTFASLPAVAKLLHTAEPATKRGLDAFDKLHAALVANPYYKVALDRAQDTLAYATSTTTYKLGAQYMYPMVQPIADVAIEKACHSKVIHQVVDYWKPVVADAAPNHLEPVSG